MRMKSFSKKEPTEFGYLPNSRYHPIQNILNKLPKDMPFELVEILNTWNGIIKSPYGFSYYDKAKGWGVTQPDTLRIADHWNFKSKTSGAKIHCPTTKPVPDNTHWTLGKYDINQKAFVPIMVLPKGRSKVGKFKMLLFNLELQREIAIYKVSNSGRPPRTKQYSLEKIKMKFLNKYFNILEHHGTKHTI